MACDSDLSLREARAIYFAANSIPPDGRYDDRWVHLRVGPIPFAFPNTSGRKRIVAAHDLHHVLTGYKTNIRGEGALAAWEIGAGCRDRTGLRLQLRVLGFALVRWPRELFRASVRGRQCRHLHPATIAYCSAALGLICNPGSSPEPYEAPLRNLCQAATSQVEREDARLRRGVPVGYRAGLSNGARVRVALR